MPWYGICRLKEVRTGWRLVSLSACIGDTATYFRQTRWNAKHQIKTITLNFSTLTAKQTRCPNINYRHFITHLIEMRLVSFNSLRLNLPSTPWKYFALSNDNKRASLSTRIDFNVRHAVHGVNKYNYRQQRFRYLSKWIEFVSII